MQHACYLAAVCTPAVYATAFTACIAHQQNSNDQTSWAARYNTWHLIEFTPKGVVFSLLFFSLLFFSFLFFSFHFFSFLFFSFLFFSFLFFSFLFFYQ